jgi:hypothetical protein
LAWYLTASWPLWVLLGIGLACAIGQCGQAGLRNAHSHLTVHLWRRPLRPLTITPGRLLAIWTLAFLALHIVVDFQVWDRYLLPLAPVLALGSGWMGYRLAARTAQPSLLLAGGTLWLGLSLAPGLAAAQGGLPIGGDHGDYSGLRPALTWLESQAPANAVIYHQVLGWHYQFYLYGRIGPYGYELRWFPDTIYLADNAARTPDRRMFLIQPDWAPVREAAHWLAMRDIAWQERFRAGHFTVYELVLAHQPYCEWCLCQPRWTGWPLLVDGRLPSTSRLTPH